MKSETRTYDTGTARFLDITDDARRICSDAGGDGLLNVFAPHATAGIVVMETGSGSEEDLERILGRLLPRDNSYVHSHGSPGHGADHLLPALLSPSVTVPVEGGELVLGTWQSIVLVDLNRDNPRRRVRFTFLGE